MSWHSLSTLKLLGLDGTHKYFLVGSSILQYAHPETWSVRKWDLSTLMLFIQHKTKVGSLGQSQCLKPAKRQVTLYISWLHFPIFILPSFQSSHQVYIRAGTQLSSPLSQTVSLCPPMHKSLVHFPLFSKRCKGWKNRQQNMYAPLTPAIPHVTAFIVSHGLRMLTKLTRTRQQREEGRKTSAFPIQWLQIKFVYF